MIEQPIPIRVVEARRIAEGIRLLAFAAADGAPLPPVSPGAHIDVELPGGLIRQYSLLDAPGEAARYTIAVAREAEGRGASIRLYDEIATGDLLTIGEPRCLFQLAEGASHSVLIAGGIGITPIWSMIQRLTALDASWELHYAARTHGHAALLGEIEGLGDGARLRTYFNLEGDPLMDLPAIIAAAPRGAHFYACGPAGMLDAYRAACAGLSGEQVHWEQFTAAEPVAREGGFVVELAKSGREVPVAPGQSILEALTAAGMRATFNCREGVCGSCETAVLSGTPDHRDAILTDDERAESRTMMICCSGSLSKRLVLDL